MFGILQPMDELEFARQLSEEAAAIAMKHFSKDPETSVKKDGTLVTIADREIESRLRERIKARFPEDGLLGEEEGLEGDPHGRIWIIDPIDGTNNYAWGIPIFATLIALRVEGRTRVGVASAPALGEIYEAAEGDGARMNGKSIRVSDVGTIEEARVCYSSHSGWAKRGSPEKWWPIVDAAKRDRGLGDFWGHMLVARGAADIMAEPSLAMWDVAALEIIVEEAGGQISGFSGASYPNSRMTASDGDGSCLSTNGVLHEVVVRALSDEI